MSTTAAGAANHARQSWEAANVCVSGRALAMQALSCVRHAVALFWQVLHAACMIEISDNFER